MDLAFERDNGGMLNVCLIEIEYTKTSTKEKEIYSYDDLITIVDTVQELSEEFNPR